MVILYRDNDIYPNIVFCLKNIYTGLLLFFLAFRAFILKEQLEREMAGEWGRGTDQGGGCGGRHLSLSCKKVTTIRFCAMVCTDKSYMCNTSSLSMPTTRLSWCQMFIINPWAFTPNTIDVKKSALDSFWIIHFIHTWRLKIFSKTTCAKESLVNFLLIQSSFDFSLFPPVSPLDLHGNISNARKNGAQSDATKVSAQPPSW